MSILLAGSMLERSERMGSANWIDIAFVHLDHLMKRCLKLHGFVQVSILSRSS